MSQKNTLNLVESQQLPEIEKVDSKNEISCLKLGIIQREKKSFQTDMDKLNIVVYRYRNKTYVKDSEMELKMTEYEKLLSKQIYLLSYLDVFFERCIVLDETTVHNQNNFSQEWMFFPLEHFPIVPAGLKISFEHNSVRKNLFLSACFRWDSRFSLREMVQNFNFGGKIGYVDSKLDSVFRYSKVFRLHAILHAAGAVRLQTGKRPGYCYMIGRGPNCCLLGHVTGLLFCLYIKIFLPSIFNFFDF